MQQTKTSVEILTSEELLHLEKVIGELEQKTSGEIRLMIVKRSSTVGHVGFFMWTILTAITALILWLERDTLVFHADLWFWPSILVVYYFLAAFLANRPAVQRWLTPLDDREAQVWTRAELEFHREGLTQTTGGTGILIFLSMMERQAVVLGDKAIAAKLPPSTWDDLIQIILQGGVTGRWAAKIEEALRLCGQLLADQFPIQNGDRNELSNTVIVKD